MKKIVRIILIALVALLVLSGGYLAVSLAKERGIQDIRINQDLFDNKVTVAVDYRDCYGYSVEYLHEREDYDGTMGTYCVRIRISDVFGHINEEVAEQYPAGKISSLSNSSSIKVRRGHDSVDAESDCIDIGSDSPLYIEKEGFTELAPFGTFRIVIKTKE